MFENNRVADSAFGAAMKVLSSLECDLLCFSFLYHYLFSGDTVFVSNSCTSISSTSPVRYTFSYKKSYLTVIKV